MRLLSKLQPLGVNLGVEVAPEQEKKVKYTITLDWFEALVTGYLVDFDSPLDKYEYDGGNIVLVKQDVATRFYKYRYDVSLFGKIFAHINCCPRNTAILKADMIQFQAVNNVMYEVGFIERAKYIFDKMGWQMHNVSRLDIAIDGVRCLDICKKVKTQLNRTAKWNKLGKTDMQVFLTGSKGILTGYDVGSRSSSKWITCYNKTVELEMSNKFYIRDMWERTGLDTSVPVERIELKLRNEAIKCVENFDWLRLDDFEYLASIFRTHCKNFFEFTKVNDKEKNVSRRKRMKWIDWDAIGGVRLPKLSTKQSNEVYRMKMTSKTMFGIYIATKKQYFADLAQEIAGNVNCSQWYVDRLPKWTDYFSRKFGNNPDGLVEYTYLANYVQYSDNEQLKLYSYHEPVYVPK